MDVAVRLSGLGDPMFTLIGKLAFLSGEEFCQKRVVDTF